MGLAVAPGAFSQGNVLVPAMPCATLPLPTESTALSKLASKLLSSDVACFARKRTVPLERECDQEGLELTEELAKAGIAFNEWLA